MATRGYKAGRIGETFSDRQKRGSVMGIGTGIALIAIGLVLVLGVVPDIPHVNDVTLGWILLVVGALGLVLSLVINAQRRRSTHVVERYDEPPVR